MNIDEVVRLTPEQCDRCWAEAERIERRRAGSPRTVAIPPKGMTMLESRYGSCCSELAVALYLGVEWEPRGPNRDTGDVAGLEVRWTPNPHGYLHVHPKDDPQRRVVFVTGLPPELHIRGWMLIGDAQRKEWWRSDIPFPAYRVPNRKPLRPFHEQMELIG